MAAIASEALRVEALDSPAPLPSSRPKLMALTAKQRQFLKRLAHPLSPVVRVGKGRITPAVIEETRRSLEAHELIKVRIESDEGPARRALAAELAREAGAEVAAAIGKLAILYRARAEKPKIKLP